jgi:pimeloyl-ACP methyl ester carboxylesterase
VNPVFLAATLTFVPTQSAPAIRLQPCEIAGIPRPVQCATFAVPERRDVRNGRQLSLRVVVVPSPARQHADPIVFIPGGPGQGAAHMGSGIIQQLQGLDEGRDVVLIDQRGTGQSSPLTCAGGFDLLSPSRRNDLAACAASLRARSDLDAYGTDDAIADLEDVRAALGYERVNLVAGSYGTRPALEYMRRYPSRVRTAVLRAVVPAGFNIVYDGTMNSQSALDRVLDDCSADAGCATAAGDVRAHFKALRGVIAAAPGGLSVAVPGGRTVVLTETLFLQTIYALLLNADTRQMLPLLITRAATDGGVTLAPIAASIAQQLYSSVAFGMYMSVVCSEDAPRIKSWQRQQLKAMPGSLGALVLDGCTLWPVTASAGLPVAVTAEIPTLIISGVLDPATPASAGDEAARHLPRAKHVVLPATAHGPLLPGCGTPALRRFLDEESVSAVDLSCAGDVKLKAFVPAGAR